MFLRTRKTDQDNHAGHDGGVAAKAFDVSPVAMLVVSDEGVVTACNGAAGRAVAGVANGQPLPVSAAPLSRADSFEANGTAYRVHSARCDEGTCYTLTPVETAVSGASRSDARFQSALGSAERNLRTLLTAIDAIVEPSHQMSGQAVGASSQVTDVSGVFEIVASAAQELDASIADITEQASRSSDEAEAAVTRTEAANETVRQLAESSERIGEVVGLIEEIAAQTNLLALNATIEAARAGEAGRGFAVVAAEVKNLAQQTTKATGDITQQIGTIQSNIGDAVSAIDGINSTIKQISSVSTTIAGAVGQQSSATAEISRNVLQAAENIRSLDTTLRDLVAGSKETPEKIQHLADTTKATLEEHGALKHEATLLLAG